MALLHHRQIIASAICSRCGDFDETVLHCICDCTFSKIIWHHIGFSDPYFFAITDIEVWFKSGLKGSHASLFAAGLWWIWQSRNAQCLSNESMLLRRLASNISYYVEDINICFFQPMPVMDSDRYVTWNNSNFNCTILYVDGSCIGSPTRAGFSGLIRNSADFYLSGFSEFLPSSDILLAELTAIYHGITITIDMGISDMVVYLDSLLSINLITGNSSKFDNFLDNLITMCQLTSELTAIYHPHHYRN